MAVTVSPNDLTWGCETCYGELSIDGTELQGPAWCVDLALLFASPEVRGSNTVLPGVLGVAAEPYRITETRFSLPLWVNGHWDSAGTPVGGGATPTELAAQLEENLAELYAAVVLGNTTTDVTQTAVWTLPSTATITAEIQCLRVPPGTMLAGSVFRSTLEIRNPLGDLHL